MVLARGMKESFKLIRRLGYRLYPSEKRWLAIGPAWMAAYMLQKMSRIAGFRNLLATGINECRALVDVLVAAAAKSKTPVSVSKILAMKPLTLRLRVFGQAAFTAARFEEMMSQPATFWFLDPQDRPGSTLSLWLSEMVKE